MAIGERIRHIRKLRKMTQRQLGTAVGFEEKTADVRMAQYESGSRCPKADLTEALAAELNVSPRALALPDMESSLGMLHTLFAAEDIYGLSVNGIGGKIVLHIDPKASDKARELSAYVSEWYEAKKKLVNGEISEEEYNEWRYNFPNDGRELKNDFDIVRTKQKAKPKRNSADEKKPEPEKQTEGKKEPKIKTPTRTVDDILAQLRANLDLMKSTQFDGDDEDEE